MYRLLEKKIENEISINKSRFITWLYPVENEQEAKDYIQLSKQLHPKAVHHCYAYVISRPYQNIENQSDDGEPSKSAGQPMLDILRHEHLINIVAIVIRYYGGIKLGVGGLIRAYGGSVKQTIDLASIKQAKRMQGYCARCNYSLFSIVQYELKKHHCVVEKISYEQDVSIIFYSEVENIVGILLNKTNNTIKIETRNIKYL